MPKHTFKSKHIAILLLAICFSAVFLLPVGLVIANTNHTHVCSSESHDDVCTGSGTYMCCSICIDVYNAKSLLSTSAASNGDVFSVFLWLLALHSVLRPIFAHVGPSSLISLKVRMNN